MSFGLNRAELIGRLGADVTVNHLASGGRVANMSIATDESYIDRNADGERIDKTEWHRCVTFQDGLIDMLEKHAKKGRLVYVAGKMQTRQVAQGRRGLGPVLHRDSAGARRARPVLRQACQRQRHPGGGRCGGRERFGHVPGSGRFDPVLGMTSRRSSLPTRGPALRRWPLFW